MATQLYYFNSYDEGGEEWAFTPEDMVDVNPYSVASSRTQDDVELCNGNTCPGDILGTISKVEIRAFGQSDYSSPPAVDVSKVRLRPVFLGGDGDNHNLVNLQSAWSDWFDITSDTNAPSPWTWTDVQNLDCDVEIYDARNNSATIGQVGIRITYTYMDIGIRIKTSSGIIKIGAMALDATHKLRIRKNGTTYGIPLITPGGADDSGIRIFDGSSVKALPETP